MIRDADLLCIWRSHFVARRQEVEMRDCLVNGLRVGDYESWHNDVEPTLPPGGMVRMEF